MTTSLNPLAQLNSAVQHNGGQDKDAKVRAAARQFEGVLLTQMLQALWKTSPQLSKGPGAMYQSMFQSTFAEHMAEGGGIGLADMISRSLGAKSDPGTGLSRHIEGLIGPRVNAPQPQGAVMNSVAAAASGMIAGGGSQWARAGQLAPEDLGTVNATAAAGASARRTLTHANGYQGYYKCNLFAFELARRAGLEVPNEIPSSNRLAQDASDGSIDSGWAKVATGASPAAMQDALRAGEAAFLLVGHGHGERHGHMAVIEQPRSVNYDEEGRVRSITFDGWEAQPNGAKHLTTRTWNRTGEKGASGDRNGLDRIEIIQLNRKDAGGGGNGTEEVRRTLAARIGLK